MYLFLVLLVWALNNANNIVERAAPPGRHRITLALVRPFGHAPHLIRAILRSIKISYFSIDDFFLHFFQSFFLMRRVQ